MASPTTALDARRCRAPRRQRVGLGRGREVCQPLGVRRRHDSYLFSTVHGIPAAPTMRVLPYAADGQEESATGPRTWTARRPVRASHARLVLSSRRGCPASAAPAPGSAPAVAPGGVDRRRRVCTAGIDLVRRVGLRTIELELPDPRLRMAARSRRRVLSLEHRGRLLQPERSLDRRPGAARAPPAGADARNLASSGPATDHPSGAARRGRMGAHGDVERGLAHPGNPVPKRSRVSADGRRGRLDRSSPHLHRPISRATGAVGVDAPGRDGGAAGAALAAARHLQQRL